MKKNALVRVLFLALLVILFILGIVFLPDLRDGLTDLLRWVERLGDWGLVILVAVYVLAAVLLFPASILTLGIGALYGREPGGVVKGFIAVSLGSVLGAAAAFFVGRKLARGWVEQKVAGNPRFRALDQAVGDAGFKIVLLTRLSPVFPYTLLNYVFGLTRVRFRDYLLASWLGMIPGTLMYVYLGSLAGKLARAASGRVEEDVGQQALFYAGLVVTVVVTVYVTHIARRALRQAIPESPSEPQDNPTGSRHE
jgi:uncharacterized membrane protein YdjX (TVP38/TMEM64 family)